jgi:transitional endoplasmic reticulum ATPase
LSQFLTEFDGVEELKGVLVLGATNRRDMLDAAILRPGRFDEIVEIPLPDEESRQQIFEVHMRNKPLAAGIFAAELAAQSDGFSGADVQSACTRAALGAVRRAVAARVEDPEGLAPALIDAEDFEVALREVRGRNE